MQKLWDTIKQDMNKDYSYLFNKDKICSFQFELKHDVKWWIKYRQRQWIELYTFPIFFFILGLILCLVQIWYDKTHVLFENAQVPFLMWGCIIWVIGISVIFTVYLLQFATIHNATKYLLSLLQQGISQQYLTNDQSKYPYFMQIAFNGSTQNTWKLCASWADKEPKCNMPIWWLVALFNCIKQYQAKYCPVVQHNDNPI